jgi:hypothetical protein
MKTHGRRRSALRNAFQALALIALARRIGFRRGRRLALLAATGYLDERRHGGRRHRH